MARIFVLVEGQTEETFVNEILSKHLLRLGHETSARIVGNARMRARRGGIRGWPSVAGDIVRRLTEDQLCHVTTMVDYYALPAGGEKAWPGRAKAGRLPFPQKSGTVTTALSEDIAAKMKPSYNRSRFIPYVMMHEFEGLLFSDCGAFANGIERPALASKFQSIRDLFSNPEEINDSFDTAPSKRVEALVEGYEKPFMGVLAILEIGLEPIRSECPIFHEWICKLEGLP